MGALLLPLLPSKNLLTGAPFGTDNGSRSIRGSLFGLENREIGKENVSKTMMAERLLPLKNRAPTSNKLTLADALLVVAKATAGAVAALGGTVAVEHVLTGGALLLGAVRTTVAQIALAPDVLGGIPRRLVGGTGGLGQGLLRHADATVGALVGTQGALAGHAVVPLEALALAAPAVANALVGALHPGVGVVGADNVSRPGRPHRACAKGAIVACKGWLAQ